MFLILTACEPSPTTPAPTDTPEPTEETGTEPPTEETGEPGTRPPSGDARIRLTEILASNATGLQDEGGAFPDWIELWNEGDVDVDLEGFALTDETAWIDQWTFPAGVVIPAGGHLVVFADGDVEEGPLHASFKLSSLGESAILRGREEDGHPWIDGVDFPAGADDVSWARTGDTWGADPTPTPGEPND